MNTNINNTNANAENKYEVVIENLESVNMELNEDSSISDVFKAYDHERKHVPPKCMHISDFRMSDSCGKRTHKIHDFQFPDWNVIRAVTPTNSNMIERRNEVASTIRTIAEGYTPAIVVTAKPEINKFGDASLYNEANVREAIDAMDSRMLERLNKALEDRKVFELALDAYNIVCVDAEVINGRYKSAYEGVVTLVTMGCYDAALQQLKYLSCYPIYFALLTEISKAKSEEEHLLAKAKERKEVAREVASTVKSQAKDSLAAIGASALAVSLLKKIILK